jgi:hypothetical protein
MRTPAVLVFVCIASACDTTSGADSGASAIGSACTADTDCPGPNAVCITTTTQWGAFPGGYCSQTMCGSFDDPCGGTGTCQPNPGVGPHCFANCTSDAQCREGYVCQTHPFDEGAYCLPPVGDDG